MMMMMKNKTFISIPIEKHIFQTASTKYWGGGGGRLYLLFLAPNSCLWQEVFKYV